MSVDPKCHELAAYFLEDEGAPSLSLYTFEQIDDLAQTIQDAIENWIDAEQARTAPKG